MSQNIDLKKQIPAELRNAVNEALIDNLFNRFVSQEDSLLVSGQIGTPAAGVNSIQQPNLERQENALVPGLFFAAGKEKFVFTFEDLVNKMKVLGLDISGMRNWLSEQIYNYTPPINYDKFVNYAQYYWVGNVVSDEAPIWNPDKEPEHYVIERPRPNDLLKMPVRLATTRNINLEINDRPVETFTVTFTNATDFTVTSDVDPNIYHAVTSISPTPGAQTKVTIRTTDSNTTAPAISAPALADYDVVEFYLVTGTVPFVNGDVVTITLTHFTSQFEVSITSVSVPGKGTATGAITISPFMYIDGVQVAVGDRILVKNQNDPSENGIYLVVSGQPWIRAYDARLDTNLEVGASVFVVEGTTQAGYTYELTTKTQLPSPPADGSINADLTFTLDSTTDPIPVNEWQLYNYWIHRDDLIQFQDLGISVVGATQSTRPIIEYDREIHLNDEIDGDGNPTDGQSTNAISSPIDCPQVKTRFNQIPQFNLYYFDGTHAGVTSGIWYYVESPNYEIDSVLKKRVKTTINSDYVFGASTSDIEGRTLYYKSGSVGLLFSIWRPGVDLPAASNELFYGTDPESNGGITFGSFDPNLVDNQQWTVTFVSPTTATVTGTRSGEFGTATVATPFNSDGFTMTIAAGTQPYVAGDYFTFNIYSRAAPRYVKLDNDGNVINYPGGYNADIALDVPVGAWLTPSRMFQNMFRETRDEITFGDFLNHGRSVIRWQDGFVGASFGTNNVRELEFNPGYGGQIRDFSSNFPLLASMLIESDISPLTIISFGEQQYNVALSSIDQFLINELAGYLSSVGAISTATINPSANDIVALEEYFEELRGEDVNLTEVFRDSTALVTNWPATLPMMGLIEKVQPSVSLDHELNINVIVHHDGHISPLAVADSVFNSNLVNTRVERSDGNVTGGIFSETTPGWTASPLSAAYKRQLWCKLSTNEVFVFNVDYDLTTAPVGASNGQIWYKRDTNQFFTWNASSNSWDLTGISLASRWIPFSPENVRNSLILAVENKLYNSVHASQQINIDLVDRIEQASGNTSHSERELAMFAAKYNYDIFRPDYDPANAFTWNYTNATFSVSLPGGTNQARWYSIYNAYFGSIAGALATDRPDLEPWKLGTALFPAQETKPAGWDATYATTLAQGTTVTAVRAVSTVDYGAFLNGLPVIDGITLAAGEKVLLIQQSNPATNGIYVVGTGAWVRSSDVLANGLTVAVSEGFAWASTAWVLTTADPITPDVTALTFQQSRAWSGLMWAAIQAHHPGIKLCVNTNTDTLLPPYVNGSTAFASQALTNTIPSGINLGYDFGDVGPVELVWTKSLEYRYGLARSFFHLYPLEFLDSAWGETYLRTNDNLRMERNLVASLPAQKFLMHGERLNIVNTYTAAETLNRVRAAPGAITWATDFGGVVTFEVTHTASSGQSGPLGSMGPSATVFSMFVDGVFVDYVFEGTSFTISTGDVSFTNVVIEDLGIPYEMGDTISIDFTPDTVTVEVPDGGTDFVFGTLGCEGCVADTVVDETIVVTDIEHQPIYEFIPGQAKIFKGVGQWFTNLLRYSYIDTGVSTAALAYRAWDIKLVHRLGSLIRPDLLTIASTSGEIPTTGYTTLLKRATNTRNLWISALRVQVVQMGTKTLSPSGLFVPVGAADDWIFRLETYNIGHPEIEYNTFDLGGGFTTFTALNSQSTDIPWRRYQDANATFTSTTPIQITGLQSLLNTIYGYIDQLTEQGFELTSGTSDIDQETGRFIDWQLEIEKMINNIYSGVEAGSGLILNPFMEKITVQTPFGLLGRYSDSKFLDVDSTQACYDVVSAVIPLNSLRILRTDPKTVTYSTTPIYSAHLFVDEFEHAVLMNDHFSADPTSTVIFDQFVGSYTDTAYLTYSRQNRIDGKPTMDGFFLNDNEVKRNPVSMIDALSRVYDAGQTFNEPSMAPYALSLIGFKEKDYFKDINISPQTQLDFWRGMISAKGTNLTINAFTNYKAFLDSSVDEFWAYKLAEYGDARERTFPEIKINPNDCSRQFTGIQFQSIEDPLAALPLFIQVEPFDDTRWFSIDDLGTSLRFDAVAISEVFTAASAGYYTLENTYHTGDGHSPTVSPAGASMITANILKVTTPGTYTISGFTWINKTKLSPVKLFDYSTDTLVKQVSLWHPAIGVHTPEALGIVNISAPSDPAHYNYTTQTINNPSYLALKPWESREVGRVWWDTSKLAYIPYHDANIFPNRETRQSRWGSLAEYASVDLYEWTESDYHPSEYDAQAALQEGDSSIETSIRLSGRVGFTNYYQSTRSVSIKPIAWSQTSTSNGNAHPAFGPSTFVQIFNSNNRLVADTGRLADINVIDGFNFGGWDIANSRPIGEVVVGDEITYDLGTETYGTAPVFGASTGTFTITIESNGSTIFGTRIGKIELIDNTNPTGAIDTTTLLPIPVCILRMKDSTGFYEDLTIVDWNSPELISGSTRVFNFESFGLQIVVNAIEASASIAAQDIIDALVDVVGSNNDIFIREAVSYTEIPHLALGDLAYSNNPADGRDHGWKVWQIPTQSQLSNDLRSPKNKWLPYVGAEVAIANVTTDVVEAMNDDANSLTLVNGIPVNRYSSTWSDWDQLTNTTQTIISDGNAGVEFTLADETELDTNRLSIYANGIQLAPATISISDNVAVAVNTTPEGTTMYLLYRAYQPTDTELAFDPEVEDDFQIQTRYKIDYQYTQRITRNSDGNIAGTKYYFWVKDKTIPQTGKSTSLRTAAQLLQYGDSTYMIFSRLTDDTNSDSGVAYDSCAISGLGTNVSKIDSYKLRFIRNFTLRDDPEEIQLKNVHTEWTLIRERMPTKLPAQLWLALTNAVCGQDAVGNQLPSQTRINYDTKYGTNTRYGFGSDQIFVESDLALTTIINTILNTSVQLKIGDLTITDYITALGITSSSTAEQIESNYFSTPEQSRGTMTLIYNTSRASQINEIFFSVLNDALANNYQFTDLFKTSLITANSSTVVAAQSSAEQINEFY